MGIVASGEYLITAQEQGVCGAVLNLDVPSAGIISIDPAVVA